MLKLILLITILLCNKWVQTQRIVRGPIDKFVYETSLVEFKCEIEDYQADTDLIQWCKNNFCTWGRTVDVDNGRRLQYKSLQRYFVVGNRSKGEWNLLIENVTASDEGEYKCVVVRQSDDTSKTVKFESNRASLKLMRTPKVFQLNKPNDASFSMVLGHIESIECRVVDAVPAPIIHWQLSDGTQLTQYSTIHQAVDKTTNVYTYTSKLEVVASMDYDNKSIQCVIAHPTLNKPIEKTLKINLNYAPMLTISSEPNENLIEDRTYTFTCNSDSRDTVLSKRFYLDSENRVESNDAVELTITVDRTTNGRMIICEYENRIGTTKINQTLDVYYPPKFVKMPDPLVITNRSQSVDFDCQVDSNPPASIVWLKNDNDLIEMNTKLKLTNMHRSAEYTCKATNHFFDTSIVAKTFVIVQGVPTIIGNQMHTAEIGMNLNVEFQILSSPPYKDEPVCHKFSAGIISIDDIVNAKSGDLKMNPLDLDDTVYGLELLNNNQNHYASKYLFKIKAIRTDEDFGVFGCTISNEYGNADFLFEVKRRPDNKNLLLLVLASTLSFLFVLVAILAVSIMLCRRRLQQKSKIHKNALPCVIDDLNIIDGHSSDNSPNLSVSEWTPTTGNTKTSSLNDDQSSDKSNSSQRNLLANHDSSANISIIMPSNKSNTYYPFQPNNYTTKCPDGLNLNPYDAYLTYTSYQNPNGLMSKFQTNV